MSKRIIILMLFLIISGDLWSGIHPPSPRIAKTYRIGIISNEHQCIIEIKNDLKLQEYNLHEYGELNSPWHKVREHELDFLIYKSENKINLLTTKGHSRKSFSINQDNLFCLAPVSYIWRNTQEKNDNPKKYKLILEIENPENSNLTLSNKTTKELKEIIKQEPNNVQAHFQLAKLFEEEGNDKEQLKFLSKAAGIDPFNCEVIIAIGNYHLGSLSFSSAIEEYSKCLDDPINSNISNYNIGLVYEISGKNKKALTYYKKVHEHSHIFGVAQKRIYSVEKRMDYLFIILLVFIISIISYFFKKKTINKNLTNKNKQLDYVRRMIAEGKIEKAFSTLEPIAKKLEGNTNDLTMLKGRWVRVNKKENMNVLSLDEIEIEKNKITKAILDIVKENEKSL